MAKKYDRENSFPKRNQSSAIFHARENSKMLYILILKYFSVFNNMLRASWVVHITRVLVFSSTGSGLQTPICIYQSRPSVCIYQSRPSICIYQSRPSICIYQPRPSICIYQPLSITIGNNKSHCFDIILLFTFLLSNLFATVIVDRNETKDHLSKKQIN